MHQKPADPAHLVLLLGGLLLFGLLVVELITHQRVPDAAPASSTR
jgi:hypothetical protein